MSNNCQCGNCGIFLAQYRTLEKIALPPSHLLPCSVFSAFRRSSNSKLKTKHSLAASRLVLVSSTPYPSHFHLTFKLFQ